MPTSFPPRPLGYSPYELLADRPHLMVDGAARPSSVLTLSHWPQSPTPVALARDLSAEIVLAYLALDPDEVPGRDPSDVALSAALARAGDAEAVTNDHFDEDGLMSVWALTSPETAFELAELVVDVAACGDFGIVRSDRAAEVAFAIEGIAEAEAGPAASTSERYLATLPLVEHLLRHPEQYSRHWSAAMEELERGRAALASSEVTIETVGELDLAVVSRQRLAETRAGLSEGSGGSAGSASAGAAGLGGTEDPGGSAVPGRFPGALGGGLPIHATAVHSVTTASRVLAFDGAYCECYLRYEGWVRFVSRDVPLRPDLAPLAAELTALEPAGVAWEANPVGAIIGRLMPDGDGRSDLAPYVIRGTVEAYLASAPPAWDPFRPGGGYIPENERPHYSAARLRQERSAGFRAGRRSQAPRRLAARAEREAGGVPPAGRPFGKRDPSGLRRASKRGRAGPKGR